MISNLKFWIKADAGVVTDNEKVSEWHDQSKNNYVFFQQNQNKKPILHQTFLNNLPSIYFDGLDDWMKVLFGDTCLQPNTIILVANIQNKGSDSYFFDGINLDLRHVLYKYSNLNDFAIWAGSFGNFTLQDPYKPNLLTTIFNQSSSSIYNNGQQIWSGNTGNYGLSGLYLGCSVIESWHFKGYISEVLFFDSLLPSQEREKVQLYLMNKYAPPVNLGPDILINYGFCPVKLGVSHEYSTVLWSTGSTADTIFVNQTGQYTVQVVDIFGRLSTDTVYVQFPHFGFSDAINCLGDSTEYISIMPGPYQYLWSDLSTNENLFIKQAGIYWLKLTDTLGCSFTDTFFVAVDSFAVMASLGPDMTVCSGESISLVSGDQPVDYLWSTTEITPSIVVQTDGMYALTVTNINECVAVDTLNILISGVKPDVGFAADSVCFGYPTSFTDTSSATAPDALAFWEWNFNGTTATAQHPQFQFAEPGIHSVQLYVETDSGCTATTVQNVFVIPNPQPAFIPAKGCSGQPIQFTNQTTLGYGNIIGYEWQAKDSLGNVIGVSAATHANFTFPQPGMYHVTLAAITADGCRDSVTRTVEIRRSPPVDFTWSNICIGQITSFTETTQVPPQEMIVERFWDFGDNMYSVLTNPLHYFQNTGTYNVSLFNRSLNGCENTVVKQVSIRQLPVAGLDYSLPCLNTPVEFVSTSTVIDGTIDRVVWTFPNGDTTSLWNPVYAFPDTGNYMISLVAVSNHGCIDSTKQTVTIHPYPEAAFTFSPEYGVPPLDVSFTNLSTGASSYFWNFGDNTFSTAVNPVHTYQETSVYSVLLIAVNTFLCSDSIFGTVYVIPSTYDIAVVAAEQTVSAQLVQSSVKVKNLGNRIVRKLLMKYQIDFGTTVTEQWQGILMPGQETWFTFSSLIDEADLAGRKVICYSVLPDEDVVDANPQNNTSCRVLDPGFYIMSVAPNPANNLITIHLVLKTEGQYNFEMLANDGRMAIERSGLQGSAGINVLEVDVSALQQGVYLIRITNESDKDLRRVMIVR
jgi:PKD repeat protein